MREKINQDPNGFVFIRIFLNFKKLNERLDKYTNLNEFKTKLIEISLRSSKKLLVSSEKSRVRRRIPWKENESNILNKE